VKMAKPKDADFAAMMRFANQMESVIEYGEKITDHDTGETVKLVVDSDHFGVIEEAWEKVAGCFRRVVMAGHTAIANACDPAAATLEYKPEIRRAIECHDDLLAACKAALAEFRNIRPHTTANDIEGCISGRVLDRLEIAILKAEGTPE
jgi:hypothetical protein